ncbi:FdhF/YdeP family oxidoreductase [bacterium]|nr:MAG: FdhF/YdeP family oxidoreductase [bacterium]
MDHRIKNSSLKRLWDPRTWVSLSPNGIGKTKPNHFLDMAKIVWENRSNLRYAWRVLSKGVCDGCALGVAGFHDWTIESTHLCMVRLKLLRLNTAPALDYKLLEDVERLKRMDNRELRELGRLPYPMIRKKGEQGFARISWNQAYEHIAEKIRVTDPKRLAFYLTSRGITNEVYYVAQKVARFLGTNNVDNSARICHSPSTVALKSTIGAAATTCSYTDWFKTDLIVFFGSNAANDQPVTMKYLYYAKKNGTKVVCVNPYREPGMENYWVPSVTESALFGTKITDEFFLVHTGGDIAFINGVIKWMIAENWLDNNFIKNYSSGFSDLKNYLENESWENLEKYSGLSRVRMKDFAALMHKAKRAVLVWSMGITQHSCGSDSVRAIVNLGLTKGFVGREGCGLMPIRGHSGVQGGAEVGAYATVFPGGKLVTPESAAELSEKYGFKVPEQRGLTAVEMIDAASENKIDILYQVGGNFLEVLPDPVFVKNAINKIPLRIHQDIILTNQMLMEPNEAVLLLPAKTRYEQRDGGTETTTERRIIFSPQIEGNDIGETKSEWEILMELAEHVLPEQKNHIDFESGWKIRDEIARIIPMYDGIQDLKKSGDHVQWGGIRLCDGWKFPTANNKANFTLVKPKELNLGPNQFLVSTRRGKQFNSMVQDNKDPLTGAERDAVLISAEDAENLRLQNGDAVTLSNKGGTFKGRIKISSITPKNLQVHWPEGNILLQRGVLDPEVLIPDFNSIVEIRMP